MSLCSVPPLRGTVYKGKVRHLLLNIAFIPPQHWSENQNHKHNTSAHACIFSPVTYPIRLFLAVWLSLRWSLYFPFLSGSCDANPLIHAPIFFFFWWITSVDALYSLLFIQLIATAASLLLVVEICTHAKTEKHAHSTFSHTHAQGPRVEALCWEKLWTAASGEY